MKSKNIPADIKHKSIKEAQNEINRIIEKLEDSEINLKNSMQQYQRMIHLNQYIQSKFIEKAKEIQQSSIKKDKKKISKYSK
jgi:exonuclease VII small subunit|tara:strand:- start:371 stop:616 length:246 start_codon:yes stop_codon:yes gene_type:complete